MRCKRPAIVGLVAPAALLVLLLTQGQTAHATTITVTTTDDELNADGDCSLREAIQAANTDTAMDDCAPWGNGYVWTLTPIGEAKRA